MYKLMTSPSSIHRLQEQDSLTRELDKVQTEKDTIEQTLNKFISQLTIQSETNQITK